MNDTLRDHLRTIGSKGGKKRSPAQKLAFLRALAVKHPNSPSVKLAIEVAEHELGLQPGHVHNNKDRR